MNPLQPPTISAATAALSLLAAADASALQRAVGGPRITVPSQGIHFSWEGKRGFHGGFPVFVVEREVPVIIEREVVVREVAPAAPPAPPQPPRKPYVVGKSYAALPASCMKLIEGGASYYYCGGGEWYRLAGKQYLAVRKP